jgi:hypothetical protein
MAHNRNSDRPEGHHETHYKCHKTESDRGHSDVAQAACTIASRTPGTRSRHGAIPLVVSHPRGGNGMPTST